jgi:hypothetical protein
VRDTFLSRPVTSLLRKLNDNAYLASIGYNVVEGNGAMPRMVFPNVKEKIYTFL